MRYGGAMKEVDEEEAGPGVDPVGLVEEEEEEEK